MELRRTESLWATGLLQRLAEVPGHPLRRIGHHFGDVPLQFGEVVERVGAIEITSVDQAHEEIAHLGAIERAVKQCILAMEHRAFQHLFAEIVIQERRLGAEIPSALSSAAAYS